MKRFALVLAGLYLIRRAEGIVAQVVGGLVLDWRPRWVHLKALEAEAQRELEVLT